MAETAETDGTPEWYTREQAAELMGVSVSAIRKWEREGKLKTKREGTGNGERVLIDASTLRAMQGGERDPIALRIVSHLETVYRSRNGAFEDMKGLAAEQRQELQRCYGRIKELETWMSEVHKREAETLKSTEAVLTMRHERDLELATFERTQSRRDRAFSEAKPLVRAIAARLGLPVGMLGDGKADADPMLRAGRSFRDELTADQMGKIMAALSDKQKASLLMFFDTMGDEPPDETAAGASGGEGNGSPAAGGA